MIDLRLGDCLEILKTMPPGSVDAVVTDPPYGIGGDVVRSAGKRVEAMPAWDRWGAEWISDLGRVLSSDANVVAFTDGKRVDATWQAMSKAGLRPQQILYWIKHAPPPNPRHGFQSSVEVAVWARRNSATWNGGGLTPNVWYEGPHKGKRSHPAEKPIGVMRWLIDLMTNPGDTILDPFMGSGTTGVACVQTGRNFIGCEIDSAHHKTAVDRLNNCQKYPQT